MPIEYAPGGSWNPLTGCLHALSQCPISDGCWARSMAHRFPKAAGGDFDPRFHPERLEEPFKWRKPRRVAVCFMGDMFGAWIHTEAVNSVLNVVRRSPQHTFLFLTKNPKRLAEFNLWPSNAWVGASVTNFGSFGLACGHLEAVEARVKWLSIEPLMDWRMGYLKVLPSYISWVVIGGYSGRSRVQPRKEWVEEITEAADSLGIPVWEKSNLAAIMGRPLRQELPHA